MLRKIVIASGDRRMNANLTSLVASKSVPLLGLPQHFGTAASLCSFPKFGNSKMIPFRVKMMPIDGFEEPVSALDSAGQRTSARGKSQPE
jgi:hypothetical protein